MLFLLPLAARVLTRLLVLPRADDSAKDLEILVLRHHRRRDALPSSQEPQRRQRPRRPMAGTPHAAALHQIGVHHRRRQPSTVQALTHKPPAMDPSWSAPPVDDWRGEDWPSR